MNKSPLTLAVGGLLAMAAGIGVGRFVYTPILPPMVEALHLSKSAAGLIASANFVGYLAGALLATMPLPGSRRTWLLGALAVNAVGLAAMGSTSSLTLFLLLRLIAGIASAFALIFRESAEIDSVTRACLDAGYTCWPAPSAFVRYAIYAAIAFLEVVALFMVSLTVERRIRNRHYSPEWR